MLEVSLLGLVLASLAAISKWQTGFYLAVAVAFVQDPLRKIIDGQPPYFILFTGVVFGAALLGALRKKIPLSPNMVVGWRRYIGSPFQLYAVIVIAQAAHSLLRYSNPMIPMLGVINYLAPFVALALAHAFAATVGSRGVHSFLRFYVVCAAMSLATVYLESAGYDWPILGEVGVGIRIYDLGTILTAHSGTFRASEIAAWHAATCACVVLLLLTQNRVTLGRVLVALAIVALLVSIGILTGRRKFLVMIAIFGAAYVGILGLYWNRVRAVALPAALAGLLVYFLFLIAFDPDVERPNEGVEEYQLYIQRTSSVFSDVPERFVGLGMAPFMWAYEHFGLLGGGAGIGTQGVQHMVEMGSHAGAAEGGLGKLMVELGLPGVLAAIAVGWAFCRHIWRLLGEVARQSARHTRLASGLAALLIANFASFSVATQAFGDTFVLLFLGTCLGTLMAIPRMVARELPVPTSGSMQRYAMHLPRIHRHVSPR